MGALLGGNEDIETITEESNQPKIERFNKSNNQSNQSNTDQPHIFMRDNSHNLIGLTIDHAIQCIIEHKITHDGKQITWIIDSEGSISNKKGICIVETKEGKITKIVENF
jgi:hypothetical protein